MTAPDREKERWRKYRAANRERINAARREQRKTATGREAHTAAKRLWRAKNRIPYKVAQCLGVPISIARARLQEVGPS